MFDQCTAPPPHSRCTSSVRTSPGRTDRPPGAGEDVVMKDEEGAKPEKPQEKPEKPEDPEEKIEEKKVRSQFEGCRLRVRDASAICGKKNRATHETCR